MTGQDAANTAKAFNDALPLTGVVLTKADGDARGGAALSVRHISRESLSSLSAWGRRWARSSRSILIESPQESSAWATCSRLSRKPKKKVDKAKAEKLARKIKKGKGFDLEDFKEQLAQMQNMGGVASIMDKMPGHRCGLPPRAAKMVDDSKFRQMEAIINSMTPRERTNPDALNGSRKRRITVGSGTQIQDLNRLLEAA